MLDRIVTHISTELSQLPSLRSTITDSTKHALLYDTAAAQLSRLLHTLLQHAADDESPPSAAMRAAAAMLRDIDV